MVLENSTRADEHDCPFVRASMHLTKMICEILRIGDPRESSLHCAFGHSIYTGPKIYIFKEQINLTVV